MSNLHKQAVQIRDALVDCMNTVEILRRRVDELVDDAAKESGQTGDIRQAALWLKQGKRVCKDYWEYNYLQAVHGAVFIHGIHLGNIVRSAPWNPSPADLSYPSWRVVEKGGRPNE